MNSALLADDACTETEVCDDERFDASVRIRYANIDDNVNQNANALTASVHITLRTPDLNGFSATLTTEHVNDFGIDSYNDGGTNGQVQYAAEVDPSGTELDEGFIQYANEDWRVRWGRQYIDFGTGPQRFISSVRWRQNYQTFDALTVDSQVNDKLHVEGAIFEKVYRVIGRDHPNRAAREWDMDGFGIHSTYAITPKVNLEGYALNLDFVDNDLLSARTLGLKLDGDCGFVNGSCVIDLATQSPLSDSVADYNVQYLHTTIEIPFANFAKQNTSGSVAFRATLLEGDGENSFKTPLAALHAFAGWSDRFLVNTPTVGLTDIQLRLAEKLLGWDVQANLHHLRASRETEERKFGNEIDLLASRTLGKYKWLFKLAHFQGNEDWRPHSYGTNVTKAWVSVEFAL
ncbi:MAG: hypothetical protein F4W90_09795 [Gammaproteobacteria bacterium]|nr:hypothetical protein [Gammaproteobacteria bacterium]